MFTAYACTDWALQGTSADSCTDVMKRVAACSWAVHLPTWRLRPWLAARVQQDTSPHTVSGWHTYTYRHKHTHHIQLLGQVLCPLHHGPRPPHLQGECADVELAVSCCSNVAVWTVDIVKVTEGVHLSNICLLHGMSFHASTSGHQPDWPGSTDKEPAVPQLQAVLLLLLPSCYSGADADAARP
jgi:hypothetical protein